MVAVLSLIDATMAFNLSAKETLPSTLNLITTVVGSITLITTASTVLYSFAY